MATATAILVAVLARTHEAHVADLRRLAARSLWEEARAPFPLGPTASDAALWWTQRPGGPWLPRGAAGEAPDSASAALAQEALRRRQALLEAGSAWQPIRFAAPLADGGVALAWMPPAVPAAWVGALLLGGVAIFSALGAYLMRRGVTLPLQRMARAARGLADGASDGRVPVEGVRETAELALAFNEMTAALESRTGALEKAVHDLRASNESLREARAGLDRAARLAAVGRLAAGVAHEVGNPMGAVLAFLDLAGRAPELSQATRGYVERAAREGERVRGILRQLLDFSRPPRTRRVRVPLPPLCEEVAALLRAQRRYAAIAIEVEEEAGAPAALADPGVVSQILLNLLLNAADALCAAATPDPCIWVRVRPAALRVREGEYPAAGAARREPDAVACLVVDNGPGVPAEDRERIFDPFFTTKPVGEGTGLGLANALRFAEECGGRLELALAGAEPGAVFALTLPAAAASGAGGEARRGA
jgi:signal transduction histidine kinase